MHAPDRYNGAVLDAQPSAAIALPAWIVGHRGARAVVPENSLEGFAWAIDNGVGSVELDVRLTRDEVLVCVHDETLAAYGGPARPVAEMTAAEVEAAVLAGGVRVPRLSAVLDLAEGRLAVNVEVKNHRGEASFDQTRRSAAVLAELLDDRSGAGRDDRVFAVSSFDVDSVTAFSRRSRTAPDVAALLTPPGRDAGRILRDAAAADVTAVHPHHSSLVRPAAVRRLLAADLVVRTWTVNNRRLAHHLLRAGVHAVVTDDPVRLAGPAGARPGRAR